MNELEPTKALNAALAGAQGEFPTIPRDKTVKTGTYEFSYAELGTILNACRPILAKHGLALTQLLDEGPGLRTELRHKDGGVIGASFPLTRIPENPQQLGSLLTYLRRYAIVALLGIAAEDDDDAGQASQFKAPKPKTKRDVKGEADDELIVDYLSDAQQRKIYALRAKLIKAGTLDEEMFDKQLSDDYGATTTGLTRTQASELIDRLEKAEKKIPT